MEELLARYSIPKDRLNKKISDEHLNFIAKFINHADLGPELGLTSQQMHDIEEEERSSGNRKRIATLRKWRKKYGFKATYEELIKALMACQQNDQAENVCSMLSDQQDGKIILFTKVSASIFVYHQFLLTVGVGHQLLLTVGVDKQVVM